jgi:hypothetical protein
MKWLRCAVPCRYLALNSFNGGVNLLFEQADVNKDGKIDFKEMVNYHGQFPIAIERAAREWSRHPDAKKGAAPSSSKDRHDDL